MQPYNFQQQGREGYQFIRPPAPSPPPVVFNPYLTNVPPYNANSTFIPLFRGGPMIHPRRPYHGLPLQPCQFPYVPFQPEGPGIQYIPNNMHQQQFPPQQSSHPLSPLIPVLPEQRSSPVSDHFSKPTSQPVTMQIHSLPCPEKEEFQSERTSEVHENKSPLLSKFDESSNLSHIGDKSAQKQELRTQSEQSDDADCGASFNSDQADGFKESVSQHALCDMLNTSSSSLTQKTDKDLPVLHLTHCDSFDSSEDFEFQLSNLLQQIPMLPDSPQSWTPDSSTSTAEDEESQSGNHCNPSVNTCESESVDCGLNKEFKDRAAYHGISIQKASNSKCRKVPSKNNSNENLATNEKTDVTQKSAEFNAEIFLEKAINCGITVGEKVCDKTRGATSDRKLEAYVEHIVHEVIDRAALQVINENFSCPDFAPTTGEKVQGFKSTVLNPDIPAFEPSFTSTVESIQIVEQPDLQQSIHVPSAHCSITSPRSAYKYNPEAPPFIYNPVSFNQPDEQGTDSHCAMSTSTYLPKSQSEFIVDVSSAVVETVDSGKKLKATKDRCIQTPLAFCPRDVSINTDECCWNEASQFFLPNILTRSCGMMTSSIDVCSRHVQANLQACLTCEETRQRLLVAEVMVVRLRSQFCLMELERRLHELTYSQLQSTHFFLPHGHDENNINLLMTNQILSLKKEISRIKDLEEACVEALEGGLPMKNLPDFTIKILSASDIIHCKPNEVDETTLNNQSEKSFVKPEPLSLSNNGATWQSHLTDFYSKEKQQLSCVKTDKTQHAEDISFANCNLKQENKVCVLNEGFESLSISGQNNIDDGSEVVSLNSAYGHNFVPETHQKKRGQLSDQRINEMQESQTHYNRDLETGNTLRAQKITPLQQNRYRRKSEELFSLHRNRHLERVDDDVFKFVTGRVKSLSDIKSVVENKSDHSKPNGVNKRHRKPAFAAVMTSLYSDSDSNDVSGLEMSDDLDATDVQKEKNFKWPFQKNASRGKGDNCESTVGSYSDCGSQNGTVDKPCSALIVPGLIVHDAFTSDIDTSPDVDTYLLVRQARDLLSMCTTNKGEHNDQVKFTPMDSDLGDSVVKKDLTMTNYADDYKRKRTSQEKLNLSSDEIKEFPCGNMLKHSKVVQADELTTKFNLSQDKSSDIFLNRQFLGDVRPGEELSRLTSNEILSAGKDTEEASTVLTSNAVTELENISVSQFQVASASVTTLSGPVSVSCARDTTVTSSSAISSDLSKMNDGVSASMTLSTSHEDPTVELPPLLSTAVSNSGIVDTLSVGLSVNAQTKAVGMLSAGISEHLQTSAIDAKSARITSGVDHKSTGISGNSLTNSLDPMSLEILANSQTSSMTSLPFGTSSNSQTSSVNPLSTESSVNAQTSAVDPVLYQAVLVQLTQAYPQMVANPPVLQAVCLQQTMVLQCYMQNNVHAATHLQASHSNKSVLQATVSDNSTKTFSTHQPGVDQVGKADLRKVLSGNKSDIDNGIVTEKDNVKDESVTDVTKPDNIKGPSLEKNIKVLRAIRTLNEARTTICPSNLSNTNDLAEDHLSISNTGSKAADLSKETMVFQSCFPSLVPLHKPESATNAFSVMQNKQCSKISSDLTPTWFDTIQPLRRPGDPSMHSLKPVQLRETVLPESLQQYALHKRKRSGHEISQSCTKPSFSAVLNTSETTISKAEATATTLSGKFTKLSKTCSKGKTSGLKSGLSKAAEDWESGSVKGTEENWDSKCDPYPTEFKCNYDPKRKVDLGKLPPKPLLPLPGFSKKKTLTKVTPSHAYSTVACVNFSTIANSETSVSGVETFTAKEHCVKTNKEFLSKLLHADKQSNDRKGKSQKKQKIDNQPVETKLVEELTLEDMESIAVSKEEDWQKVCKKKKRDLKEKTKAAAPKAELKKSNYEKLVLLLQSKFPQLDRPNAIDVILKIRSERGVLSGLTVNAIVEMTTRIISRKQLDGAANLSKNQYTLLSQKSADDEGDVCPICCEELVTAEVNRLDCGHEFHVTCIRTWLLGHERTCPTCRRIALLPEEFPRLGK